MLDELVWPTDADLSVISAELADQLRRHNETYLEICGEG